MANLEIENTGVDHLYPDGVPIAEVIIDINDDVYKRVGRITSLAAQTDPFFNGMAETKKMLVELHGNGDRITRDFLKDGAEDVLAVFEPLQRWMTDEAPGPIFEFDSAENAGKIIYRWQIMDTRLEDYKLNYTSATLRDIRKNLNVVQNQVLRYLKEALRDYVLRELYEAVGHDVKHAKYIKSFAQSRQHVAFWVKTDSSKLTQYHYAGV